MLTPLNSIGRGNLRASEPTAVFETIGCGVENERMVSIPGPTPSTAAGVTGVGVGLAVGVGVGLAVGEGVGVGRVKTGKPLAPVAYETFTPVTAVDGGTSR
jgi:hypothetical protein